MKRSPTAAAGLVICTLLGVLDIAGMAALGTANAPPTVVVLAGGVLGIVTVAAVVPAWRGHRGGMTAIVGSRLLSALLGFPAFFSDKAPGWAQAVAGVAIAATILAIALLARSLRGTPAAPQQP